MAKKSIRLLSLLITITLCFTFSAVPVSADSSKDTTEQMAEKSKLIYLQIAKADSNQSEKITPKKNEEGKWIRMHSDPTVFEKNFTLTPEQKIYAINKCEYVASKILKPEMSDLEKYYTLAIWLNKNVSYDWHLWSGGYDMDFYTHQWDAYGVLKERKSICAGIAVTYAILCHAADLPCKFVRMKPASLDHTINYIPDINGHAYYIDVTENILFMSKKTNPWNPLDLKFSHIKKIPDNSAFEYTSYGGVVPSEIKLYYNTPFSVWFKEFALHKNTKKVFKTAYVEKGSGKTGTHRASYKDYPRQSSYTEKPGLWFLEDFYKDPSAISSKILSKEFDEQLVDVSGIKGSYDCSTAEELVQAVRADMAVRFFPSSENGKVVAKAADLTDNTDYTVTCDSFNKTKGKAGLTIRGTGEYKGVYKINVRVNSASVTAAPASEIDLVYNEYPQALCEPGEAENGTILYAACKKGKTRPALKHFKPDIPAATDAGKYDVWYMVKGDKGYFDVQPQKTETVAVIAPVQSTFSMNMTLKAGETVRLLPELIEVQKEGFSFLSSDSSVATVSQDGKVTALAKGSTMIHIGCNLKGSDQRNVKVPESMDITINVKPAANPMTLNAKQAAKVKHRKVRKKAQIIKRAAVIEVKNAKGKLAYKFISAKKGKKSFKKYFMINARTGDVTVKKGLKKGTYMVTVQVRAAGNASYKASSWKSMTFKVRVK